MKISSHTIGDSSASNRVVFLHGLFGRGKNFGNIAKGLEPEFYSLMVDLPNHGESEWTQDFSYEEMADMVADHLYDDFAADGPVDVVGHSMGGKVAMILALRHPDLVRRLVVVDISPSSTDSSGGQFRHLLGALATLDLATLKSRSEAHALLEEKIPELGVRGFLLQNLKRVKASSSSASASSATEPSQPGFVWEPNLELLHAQIDEIMAFPEINQAAFLGPVLWIGGSESGYVTDADKPAMHALFPLTEGLTIQGAGHWVHSEKPAEVIEAIRNFLL